MDIEQKIANPLTPLTPWPRLAPFGLIWPCYIYNINAFCIEMVPNMANFILILSVDL